MRSSTVDKNGMKQGAWSAEEDRKLIDYITRYRVWNWGYVAKYSGLSRNGKSCRLRWVNYLNPDIKRGNITKEEEQIIVDMYAVMGSRWSAIAKRLPGRTDNEIKNYWYTRLKKKRSNDQNPTQRIEPPHTAETATWEDIGGENSSTRSSSSAASEASNSPADSTNMILTMSATTTSEVSNSPPASINMVLTTSATTSSEASNSPLMIHARGSDNIQVVDNAGTDHHNSFLLQTFGQDFSDIPTDTYNCTGNTYTENDHHLEAYVQERLCSYGPFNDDEYRLNDNSYLPDVVNTCMVGAEMPNCIQHLSYNCTGNTYTESDHQLEAYVQEWPLRSYEPFNSDEYRLNDDNLPDIGDTSMVRSEMPNIQHLSYNCTGNMYADNDHQLEAYVQECACQEEPSCSYDGPFIVDEYQLNHYNYLSDDLVASLVGSSGMPNIQHLPY